MSLWVSFRHLDDLSFKVQTSYFKQSLLPGELKSDLATCQLGAQICCQQGSLMGLSSQSTGNSWGSLCYSSFTANFNLSLIHPINLYE